MSTKKGRMLTGTANPSIFDCPSKGEVLIEESIKKYNKKRKRPVETSNLATASSESIGATSEEYSMLEKNTKTYCTVST